MYEDNIEVSKVPRANGRLKVTVKRNTNTLTVASLLEHPEIDETKTVYRGGIPLDKDTVLSKGDVLMI